MMAQSPAAKPGILIASPQLQDPNFAGTVVLIWHHDSEGAMGAIVNRPTQVDLSAVTEQLAMPTPIEPNRLLFGGPVQQDNGYLVFGGPVDERMGWNPEPGVSITASQDMLEQVLGKGEPFLLCLGYSGWGPGQLEQEIEGGSWLYAEIDPALLFEVPLDKRYEYALGLLGLNKNQVWMMGPISE
ncbi:MAG: putative transcriptional regulator [Cognaticolwellia sp.]|jgi:putative transcriptional regulator